jgi:hypothetical protein
VIDHRRRLRRGQRTAASSPEVQLHRVPAERHSRHDRRYPLPFDLYDGVRVGGPHGSAALNTDPLH